MALLRRLKGYPGHPSHPPLTGVSIGAYTIAVALLVIGALGQEEPAMAHGARRARLRMPHALSLAAAGRYPTVRDRRGMTHPRAVPSSVRDWLAAGHRTDRQRGFLIARATSPLPGN
jgi:hypothetical protein